MLGIYKSALDDSDTYEQFGREVNSLVIESTGKKANCNIEHSDMADALESFYTGDFEETPKMESYVDRATEIFGFKNAGYLGKRIHKELEHGRLGGEEKEDGAVIL